MAEDKDTRTQFEKDMAVLLTQDAFARAVRHIHTERERCIKEMHDISTEGLQQLSGRILQADELLDAFGWEEIQKRHSTSLRLS